MKNYFKLLIFVIVLLPICGCNQNSSMENIDIYATAYPIEYVVNRLYGEHSTIRSIYPNGADINEYEVTDVLLSEYSDTDMFIFNGLSKEQDYVKPLLKENHNLKIIDVSSDIKFKNSTEELWVDPSNLLNIANNIKKGFKEYISAKYLLDEIDKNYEQLKVDLTNLESKYRETIRNASNRNIIVSDDLFLFLKDYGANVISLDKSNPEYEKNIEITKQMIQSGTVKYVYIKDTEEKNNNINNLIANTNIKTIKLNTLSTLTDEQRINYNYLTLVTENLENLKKQLYNLD